MIEHALRLIAMMAIAPEEEAAQARTALETWRVRSDRHAAAHAEAQRRWRVLHRVGAGLRGQMELPAARRPSKTHTLAVALADAQRRRFLGLAGLLAVGAGAAAVWQWPGHSRSFERRYRTGIGQIEDIALPDGTAMVLDADSTLAVRFSDDLRHAQLQHGRARFQVQPDAHRPFRVALRWGFVEVVGTIFSVADRGNALHISVEEGHVRWHDTRDDAGQVLSLHGGDSLTLKPGIGSLPRVLHGTAEHANGWHEGWLVFENTPLGEALPHINAYMVRPFVSQDAHVDALRLTARLRADAPQTFAEALPQILPVRLDTQRSTRSIGISMRSP